MNKKILISIALFLVLFSCATHPTVKNETVVQSSVQPNGGWDAHYSPDGSMIAFLSSTLHTPPDLWLMKADGTDVRRLTTKGAKGFRWSQDGKSISFVARRKSYEEAFSVDVSGKGEEKPFPGLPPNSSIPVYSPDGKLFAFTSPDAQRVRDLWIGTSDGMRIESVTEKMMVRSVFWGTGSLKVYYEAGNESYGLGVWEMDLSTMQSRPLFSNYIGTPVYSEKANLIAYAYPIGPGEFEVRTMKLDGSDIKSYKSPRLPGRWFSWDAEGKGVYYLGQDIEAATAKGAPDKTAREDADAPLHSEHKEQDYRRTGITALWRLDLETGEEKLISPKELHLTGFSLSPDGKKMLLSGVLQKSYTSELFILDLASYEMTQPVKSRASSWMPVPSRDSSKIAFFTNEKGIDTLIVASSAGQTLASYPGVVQEGDLRVHWLPESDALVLFSGRGLFASTEKGDIEFPTRDDHGALLYADVSIQKDQVLLNSIPKFGETPGLYMLEAVDGKFVQTDLRFPPTAEDMPELYFQPKVSFDGKSIAFTDRVDVWTMRIEGTGRVRLTQYAESNEEGKGKPALASYPFWSVDGELIGYTLTVYDGTKVFRQIWVMKVDGSGTKMLYSEEIKSTFQVFMSEYTNQPFFDATDEKVVFTGVQNGLPELFSVTVKGGKVRRLTHSGAIFPVLMPEEGTIYYTSIEGNIEELRAMNSDGTGMRRIEIKAAPAPEKSESENRGAGDAEKKEIPAAQSAAPIAEPVKEVDKPAAQTKEAEAIKQEPAKEKAPAQEKAPVKKKKPAKKKAAETK